MSDQAASWRLPPLVVMPERVEPADTLTARLQARMDGIAARIGVTLRGLDDRAIRAVFGRQDAFASLSEDALDRQLQTVREQLRRRSITGADLITTLAVLRELISRETGARLTRAQLLAVKAMLDGHLAELAPGEGKTLALIAAAIILAMAGLPVHCVVANEYFVQRDSAIAGPVVSRSGLRLATLVRDSDDRQRRAAYASDILYTCARELAFDYLRDRSVLGASAHNAAIKLRKLQREFPASRATLMRGLHAALVDDADQVLLEQAGTPMIISRKSDPEAERQWATRAWELSGELLAGQDFVIDREKHSVELTPAGADRLAELCADDDERWQSVLRREEDVRQALLTRHVFEHGRHYRVVDGRIRIIDRQTGGLLADRSWAEGLHQLLEVKEGCEVTGRSIPSLRISYQRLFRRYQHLAGTSSCLDGAQRELWRSYALAVTPISSPHRALQPRVQRSMWASDDKAWSALEAAILDQARRGGPTFVVVAKHQQADALHDMLEQQKIASVVIAGDTVAELARLQAAAVQHAVIILVGPTGLGVETYPDRAVSGDGAAHLIVAGRLPTRRLEQRLFGLVARRGIPGTVSVHQSMQDPLLRVFDETQWVRMARFLRLDTQLGGWLFDIAQTRMQRLQAQARIDMAERERRLSGFLAFAGRGE